MKIRLVWLVPSLLVVALVAGGCTGPTCSGVGPGSTTETIATTLSTTSTTLAPTTTVSSTTTSSTTSTTLGALEAYRVAMKAWADKYGPGLANAYAVISGANFLNPTPVQIQAAEDLDAAMGSMVKDLGAIQATPDLASAHADFLSSLTKMAGGVHDLSLSLQQGHGLRALSAVATIASAWQQGAAARTTLEQALGVSLSG